VYTVIDFPSKKKLREAVAAGQEVRIYQPGPFGGNEPTDGVVFLEGPHFPARHVWYAQATIKDSKVIKVK
jgi:hypothetical protein